MTDSGLLLAACPWLFYRDVNTITLADVQDAFKLAVLAQPIWAWSMALIKCGIAAMLLRLQTQKSWRQFLWFMIAVQLVMAIYNTISQLLQCIPLSGAWDLLGVSNAKCWSKSAVRSSSIAVSSVNIVTDVIFSLLPITFLHKVQRPLRERVIIGILMGLGLFASAASICKVVAATKYGATGDQTAEGIEVGMWSCLENLVGFIAATIPSLKAPFQKVLGHFGLISVIKPTTYGGSYGQMGGSAYPRGTNISSKGTMSHSHSRSRDMIKLKDIRTADTCSEENILPIEKDGMGGRPEIWCTTEMRMDEETVRERALEKQRKGSGNLSGVTEYEDEEKWVENSKPRSPR